MDYAQLSAALTDALPLYLERRRAEGLADPSLNPLPPDELQRPHAATSKAQAEVVDMLRKLLVLTNDPVETLFTSSLSFQVCACLQVSVDLGIHRYVPETGTIEIDELARAVSAEARLLVRIMRVLTVNSIFAEPIMGRYAHTSISWVLCGQHQEDLLTHRLNEGFRSASRQADALRAMNYREPESSDMVGFNLAFETSDTFWEHMQHGRGERIQRFSNAMKALNLNSLDGISSVYPFNNLMSDGGLVVDVGGNLGQLANAILSSGVTQPGMKWVVQDKAIRDSAVPELPNVQFQHFDFFEPQPIQGASAYFFRHIFHNHSDVSCARILRQTVRAMCPKTSRLLICDQVMDEQQSSLASALYDVDMMSLFGGKERTRSQWEQLLWLADERLYICKIWAAEERQITIIEARLRSAKTSREAGIFLQHAHASL